MPGMVDLCKEYKKRQEGLYDIFFNLCGPVLQIPWEEGRTITGKFYRNYELTSVKNNAK